MTNQESKRVMKRVPQRPQTAKKKAVSLKRIAAWNQFLAGAMPPKRERQS